MTDRQKIATLRKALEKTRQTHSYCEDTFYCCPKQIDYCGNDESGECNCGADDVNAIIDKALEETK